MGISLVRAYRYSSLIFDSSSAEKVYEQLGQQAIVGLFSGLWSREPSTLEYLVGSAEFFEAGLGLSTEDISIVGYTDSFCIKIPEALSTDDEKVPMMRNYRADSLLQKLFLNSKPNFLRTSGYLVASSTRFGFVSSYFFALSTSHQHKQKKRFLTRLKSFPTSLLGLSSMKMVFRTNMNTNSRWIIRRGFYSVNVLLISKPNAKLWMLSVLLVLALDSTI